MRRVVDVGAGRLRPLRVPRDFLADALRGEGLVTLTGVEHERVGQFSMGHRFAYVSPASLSGFDHPACGLAALSRQRERARIESYTRRRHAAATAFCHCAAMSGLPSSKGGALGNASRRRAPHEVTKKLPATASKATFSKMPCSTMPHSPDLRCRAVRRALVRFASDSLLERDGFELSVPLAKERRFRPLITRNSLTTTPSAFQIG
jgi:hypothetical protein